MTTPVLQSATIDGDFLTLTYDSLLDVMHQPSSSYFKVSVNGLNRGVDKLTIDGSTAILSLITGVAVGDTVTVNYLDPSTGNDVYAIQNTTGEDAASLTNQAVSNVTAPPVSDATAPSLVSASFTETTNSVLSFTFNEAMQLAAGNPATLLKNGVTPMTVSNVTVTGSIVTFSTSTTLAATDFVVLSYDGSGTFRDAAGNWFSAGTIVIGGSAANTIDFSQTYPSYYPLSIRANGGNDTLIGTDWEDRLNGGNGQDTINGGWGSDTINLSEPTRASDTVEVMLLDETDSGSIVSEWDVVYQFDVSSTTTNDKLSLSSNEIAANITHADGVDVGSLAKHSIVSGILVFEDSGGNALIIGETNLNDALGYLSVNLATPGKAVAFGGDTDGNGANDTLFVFQNLWGNYPSEYDYNALIELVGVNGATLGTTAGQNVVQIIDTTGPSMIDGETTANGVRLTFYESVASVDFAGVTFQKGNGATLTSMTPIGSPSISANVVTVASGTPVGTNDYVLILVVDTLHQSATDSSGNSLDFIDPTALLGFALGGTGDTVIDLSGLTGNYNLYDPHGGNDTLIGNAGDNDIEAGLGNDSLYGGAGVDYFEGGSGNDLLDGGTDYDFMFGGLGDDTYYIENANDFAYEDADQGTDTVHSSITHALGLNLENLILTGSNAINGTGNPLNNSITGNNANNILDGGTGNDTLIGGTGDDTYYVDTQSDVAIENVGEGTDTVVSTTSFYLYANIEALTLAAGMGDIFGVGNALGNTLTGNEGANLMIAWSGDDTLHGGVGNDNLFGVDGVDTLYGEAGIDYLAAGIGNDTLDGGDNPDEMYGEGGNDTMYGGIGFHTDIMVGGAGNDSLNGSHASIHYQGDYDLMDGAAGDDTYHVDTPNDLTFEAAAGGTDSVIAEISGAGYYLWAQTENLTLVGSTPFGVGNELNNILTGSEQVNWLLGGAGNDTLNGKAGNDVLFGEAGIDTFVFERGTGGDVVGDFATGTDKVQLTGLGFTSFAQVQANMTSDGVSTALNLGEGDFVVFNGVTSASFAAGDFVL